MRPISVFLAYGFNRLSLLMIKAHKIAINDNKIIKFKDKNDKITKEFKEKVAEAKGDGPGLSKQDIGLALKLLSLSTKYWNGYFINLWINTELDRRKNYNYPINLNINQWNNIYTQVSDSFLQDQATIAEEVKLL